MTLEEWAAIADVVGAIAVVVSLLILAHSINRNTAALETDAEKELLDAWRMAVQMPFYTNERLAEIQLKVHTGGQLSPVEAKMWENSLRALFDTWAQFYGAYENGVVSKQKWEGWNTAILTLWEREHMGEFWDEMGWHWAATGFGGHINREVERMSAENSPR